jgi:hypothetical protein
MVRVYTSSYWSDCRIGAKLPLVMPDAGALFVPMAVRLISQVVCYFGGHQAAQKTVAVHSLGLGLPFVLAALFTDWLTARIKAIRRVGRPLQLAAGGIMVLIMGIAMITGQLSAFSFWLLDTVPALGSIG